MDLCFYSIEQTFILINFIHDKSKKSENVFSIFPVLFSTFSIIHKNRIKTEGRGAVSAYPLLGQSHL